MKDQSYIIEQLNMNKHSEDMYELCKAVKAKYPGGIFWHNEEEVEEWLNCFVCLKDNKVIGKSQVMVWSKHPEDAPDYAKHAVFLHIRVLPKYEVEEDILLSLHTRVLERAKEIRKELSHKHQCQLYMGNLSHEKLYNDFAERVGFIEHGSMYYLQCKLGSLEVIDGAVGEAVCDIRDYSFDSQEAREKYLKELEWQCFEDDIMDAQQLDEYLESEVVIALAAYDQEKLIGAIWVTQNGNKHPFIQGLCVLAEYRRQNIAETLVNVLKSKLISGGYKMVELCVLTNNVPAKKLYDKLGFEVEVEEKRYRIII